MSETLTIQHEATTGIRAMFGDRWCVRRGTEYVAEFIHESDARRFVAADEAVEELSKANARYNENFNIPDTSEFLRRRGWHPVSESIGPCRWASTERAGIHERLQALKIERDEDWHALFKAVDSALSTLTSEGTKHE